MSIKELPLTKREALSLYSGSEQDKIAALARDLGISSQVVKKWAKRVPRWWAIIIINLVHRENFGLPPIGSGNENS